MSVMMMSPHAAKGAETQPRRGKPAATTAVPNNIANPETARGCKLNLAETE
jgi:hypothetical protein